MNKPCICQSGRAFKQCCDRFLNQGQKAKAPIQLMRSRYTAYALGGFGDYLLSTWKPQGSEMSAGELSIKHLEWLGLEIVSKSTQGETGSVEFKAAYVDKNGTKSLHHEKSSFERVKGRWFYANGEVF
ncbi:MAG: YchJ family protein [Gammaproteobacteria bacterium]